MYACDCVFVCPGVQRPEGEWKSSQGFCFPLTSSLSCQREEQGRKESMFFLNLEEISRERMKKPFYWFILAYVDGII